MGNDNLDLTMREVRAEMTTGPEAVHLEETHIETIKRAKTDGAVHSEDMRIASKRASKIKKQKIIDQRLRIRRGSMVQTLMIFPRCEELNLNNFKTLLINLI